MKKLLVIGAMVVASSSLAGCIGGVASGVAQGVGSYALDGAIQSTTARNMTCEEIEQDIADRSRGKINPLAIPTINRQIAVKQSVAAEKGCPGYEAVAVVEDPAE